ncbi:hypothetical protein ACLMJK_001590 [Lecanora helva]
MSSLSQTLSFHNFSWRGDKKWANASSWTVYGPIVQMCNFVFSVVEIALGSAWVVGLGSNLSLPMIIQTLLVPGCSFFNTIPSLHLHMLLRNNPPRMAMIMSAIFVVFFLASAVLMLAACESSKSGIPGGLRRAQCPQGISGGPTHGVSKAVWDVMVVFQFFSVVGYTVHGVMAWKVHKVLKRRKESGEVEMVNPDEEEARKAKARELWKKNYNREGL